MSEEAIKALMLLQDTNQRATTALRPEKSLLASSKSCVQLQEVPSLGRAPHRSSLPPAAPLPLCPVARAQAAQCLTLPNKHLHGWRLPSLSGPLFQYLVIFTTKRFSWLEFSPNATCACSSFKGLMSTTRKSKATKKTPEANT